MSIRPRYIPDLTRPHAEITMFSQWHVGTPARQAEAARVAIASWQDTPWPAGLLAHHCLLSTAGDTVLHYSQWTSEEAFRRLPHPGASRERWEAIERAVPGMARRPPVAYRLYRSVFGDGFERTPGCIVIVSFEVEGPDTQRRFVDQLIDATARSRENEPSPGDDGVIATHFHLSTDGKRAFSYVEFTDEAAHEALLRSRMREDGPVRRFVAQIPGVRSLGFVRYRVYDRFAEARR